MTPNASLCKTSLRLSATIPVYTTLPVRTPSSIVKAPNIRDVTLPRPHLPMPLLIARLLLPSYLAHLLHFLEKHLPRSPTLTFTLPLASITTLKPRLSSVVTEFPSRKAQTRSPRAHSFSCVTRNPCLPCLLRRLYCSPAYRFNPAIFLSQVLASFVGNILVVPEIALRRNAEVSNPILSGVVQCSHKYKFNDPYS
jgi:hypothetical protein